MKDLTMEREVLREKAAYVRGKIYAIENSNEIIKLFHAELFKVSDEILSADEKRLSEINAIFSFADNFITSVRSEHNESK